MENGEASQAGSKQTIGSEFPDKENGFDDNTAHKPVEVEHENRHYGKQNIAQRMPEDNRPFREIFRLYRCQVLPTTLSNPSVAARAGRVSVFVSTAAVARDVVKARRFMFNVPD